MVFKAWLTLVAAALVVTLFTEYEWQDWFNQVLTLATFGTALFVATRDFRRGTGDVVAFCFMLAAIVFNPIIPVQLDKEASQVVVVATALLFTTPLWWTMVMGNTKKRR